MDSFFNVMTLEEKIKHFLYEPIEWQKSVGYQVRDQHCRFSVHESGRGVGFHQCYRNPTEKIGNYGFCSQHAREIKRKLGIPFEGDDYFWKWVVETEYYPRFNYRLGRMQLSKTKKGYKVVSVLRELEYDKEIKDLHFNVDAILFLGQFSEDDKNYRLFDDISEALIYIKHILYSRAETVMKEYLDLTNKAKELSEIIANNF